MTSVRIDDLEFEIEDGNYTFPFATFEINDIYSPDEDMEVKYRLAKWYKPTSLDWIGLFPETWHNMKQYITFEWAPRRYRYTSASRYEVRSFIIPSKNIALAGTDRCKYELLYVCPHEIVGGVSNAFHITKTRNNDLVISEQSDATTARTSDSFVNVSYPGTDQLLDGASGSFEIIADWADWADCAEGTHTSTTPSTGTDIEPLTMGSHYPDPNLMDLT